MVMQEGAEVHMHRLTDIQRVEEGTMNRGLKSFTSCSSMHPVTRCSGRKTASKIHPSVICNRFSFGGSRGTRTVKVRFGNW